MIFNSLKIQGFKSFGKEQILDFSKLNSTGFYFITGLNNVDLELGANGVGKSSILDSICFALYGKTLSGLKAGNINNWLNAEKCKVTLQCRINQDIFEICRTWSPNSLTLDTKTISQEALEQFLGMDYSAFTYSILIGQFNQKFFDLLPSEKLQVFTTLLKLDKWLNYSQSAKDLAQKYDSEIRDKEKDLSYLLGKIDILKHTNYTEKQIQWDTLHDDTIQEIINAINELEYQIKTKTISLNQISKPLLDLQTYHIALVEESNLANKTFMDLKTKISSKQTEQKFLDKKLIDLNKQINAFSELSGQICIVCKQTITVEHVDKCLNLLKIDGMSLEKELLAIKSNLLNLYRKDEQSSKIVIDLKTEITSVQTKINSYIQEQKVLKANLEFIFNLVKTKTKDLEKSQLEQNPYDDLSLKNLQSLKLLSRNSIYKQEELQEDKNKKMILNFWEKGFKDIRLMVVEEILKEFEIHINTNLNKLGLNGWGVSLTIDSETKSGTIKKGFTVMIKSPFNDTLVPFECWSGGESQRLRLAGTLALIDLINSKTGVQCNVEFWDEPTTWMANNGIKDFLDILRQRSVDKNKQIFIIDHRDLETFGNFTGMIQVVKNKLGSEILQ